MNKKWIKIIGSCALVAGLAVAGTSIAKSNDLEVRGGTVQIEKQSEADYPALANITFDQAAAKALDAVKGQPLKMELENENGFLVYDIEVVTAEKAIAEVKVDAGSGKVLAMAWDEVDENESHGSNEHADKDYEEHGGQEHED